MLLAEDKFSKKIMAESSGGIPAYIVETETTEFSNGLRDAFQRQIPLTTSECRHPSARAIVSGNMISVVRAGFLALLFSALPTWLFAQVGSSPAKTDVYVIPFSHLDLFWGGTQEEDLSRGNRIIARALELAQEHPEFRFLLEDNVFVANFMDSQRGTPQAEALRELVKAGRIEIAPKWAAIYQNLPRGEALVRNLTYGKRYAREVFDVDPLVAHVGDIPGFTRQYPQLLSKAGIPYMVMTRMGPVDTPFFRWKAPDGSGVLVWDAVKGYGWGVNLGLHHDLDDAAMARVKEQVTQVQMLTKAPIYLGWGTDLFAPDEQLIDNVKLLSRKLAPMQFQFATPAEYFRAASKTSAIPELSGEITGSWANVDSSATPVWPPAITAADALVSAEKFAAINDALGFAPYPQDKFDHLWRKAIEGMDHNFYGQGGDIGDARKIGYSEAAILEGGEILRNSLRNIAERVRHPATKATAIVVFNPLSWTRDDSVRTHVTVYGDVAPRDIDDYRKGMRLVDEQGNSIPFDVESYSQNMSRAMMLAFTAQQVPSLGYKTYYLEPAPAAPPAAAAQVRMDDVKDADNPFRVAGADVVENRFYRLAVDRPTGRIEIFDKQLNKAISKDIEVSGAEERGGDAISVFPYTGRTIVNVIRSVELVHNGSSETVLRISGDLAGEPVTQQITLYRDLRKIDIEDTIDWKPGRYMEIQQVFPLDLTGAEVRNGVPFGSAAAGDMMPDAGPRSHDEVPMAVWKGWRQIQSWISASSPDSTITISADHQLFTVDDHAIRADMIRGTSFNQLKTFQDGRPVAVQQPRAGRYVFRYSISSAEGNWEKAQAWRRGMEWNTPLIGVVSEDELSPKSLPAERSFLSVQGATLVVSALKKADRGDGLVMRLFNETGESSDTQIHFLDQAVSFQKVNLLEEPLSTATERLLHVRPFEIDTVELPTSLR